MRGCRLLSLLVSQDLRPLQPDVPLGGLDTPGGQPSLQRQRSASLEVSLAQIRAQLLTMPLLGQAQSMPKEGFG